VTLPESFTSLQPFVATWAVSDATARDALRTHQSTEARQHFYAAMAPLLSAALDHLDQIPLAEHNAAEQTLMRLALAHAHNAQAIEVQGPDEAKHAINRQRLPISRATADQ
jgi:selenocysteine lyase/cysteine desulfurase